jgi:hypothetical protein
MTRDLVGKIERLLLLPSRESFERDEPSLQIVLSALPLAIPMNVPTAPERSVRAVD